MCLDGPPLAPLEPSAGSAVLVSGPEATGKRELLLCALGRATDHGLVVATDDRVGEVREAYARVTDEPPGELAVVDCVTRGVTVDAPDRELVRYAVSPRNLTEIGVKFTDLAEELADCEGVVVGVDSLSVLLDHWEVDRVFQFVSVLVAEVRELGWSVVMTLDETAHDDRTVATLAGAVDAVVDTRDGDAGREFRLRSASSSATAWTPF